jgi:hypothetical protein
VSLIYFAEPRRRAFSETIFSSPPMPEELEIIDEEFVEEGED